MNKVNAFLDSMVLHRPVKFLTHREDGTLAHMKNFLDCMKTRQTPNAGVEVGIAAARAGHVANFALRGSGVWNA